MLCVGSLRGPCVCVRGAVALCCVGAEGNIVLASGSRVLAVLVIVLFSPLGGWSNRLTMSTMCFFLS